MRTYIGSMDHFMDTYWRDIREYKEQTGRDVPTKQQFVAAQYEHYQSQIAVEAWCDWLFRSRTRVQLHPEAVFRDPYGVISREGVCALMRMVTDMKRGWDACAEKHLYVSSHGARYAEVRELIHATVDVPPLVAQLVALYVTRENKMFFLSFSVIL